MRPRKIILCVNDNEQELSVWKYMLDINGYRPISAISGEEAIELFKQCTPELILVDHLMPGMDGGEFVKKLKAMAPHIPMILMGYPQKCLGYFHMADAMLDKRMCSPAELLERIKIMSQRKRGPKKGVKRVEPKIDLAISAN